MSYRIMSYNIALALTLTLQSLMFIFILMLSIPRILILIFILYCLVLYRIHSISISLTSEVLQISFGVSMNFLPRIGVHPRLTFCPAAVSVSRTDTRSALTSPPPSFAPQNL